MAICCRCRRQPGSGSGAAGMHCSLSERSAATIGTCWCSNAVPGSNQCWLKDRRRRWCLVAGSCFADSYCPMCGRSWPYRLSVAVGSSGCRLVRTSYGSCCSGMILAASQGSFLGLQASRQLLRHPHFQLISNLHIIDLGCLRQGHLHRVHSYLEAQITDRSQSRAPLRRSRAWTFRLRRQLCRCSPRSSCRPFYFRSFSSTRWICGRDLPRQIGQSSRC